MNRKNDTHKKSRRVKRGKSALKILNGIASVLGAFTVLVLEAVAYALRWIAEYEHTEFSKTFVHMEIKGSKRFTINPFGNFDLKGAPFVVDTYVVEMSDAGESWGWLYLDGLIICLVGLVLSALSGPMFQFVENKEDSEEDGYDEKDTFNEDRYDKIVATGSIEEEEKKEYKNQIVDSKHHHESITSNEDAEWC